MKALILVFTIAFFSLSCGRAPANIGPPSNGSERIVAVGGSAAEIIYALGAGDRLVGVDSSSIFPEAATKLPQVGYQRTLSAEGVLSLKPTLVITLPEAGPPSALQQIENSGVKVVRVANESSVEGAKAKIMQIAAVLGLVSKGAELVAQLDKDLASAAAATAGDNTRPRVIFIYSRGPGSAQVSGTGTQADAMIKLAGVENAISAYEGYKPLTPEAIIAARPDAIVIPERGLEPLGGVEGVLSLPGIAETPAGRNRKVVAIDDLLLLGFGPRLGQAVKELCEKLQR